MDPDQPRRPEGWQDDEPGGGPDAEPPAARPGDADGRRSRRAAPTDSNQALDWGLAFDLGTRLGISVILGLGVGLLGDSWFHTSPLLTLLGLLLGVGAAMYTIWDVAREAMRK